MTYVVVGGGLAGGNAVATLRESGYDGPLVLFGGEHHLPYERPPLSKGYLMGESDFDAALVREPDWYDDNDVDLRLGVEVDGVDVERHVVHAGDVPQEYDRLLLATGAVPRRLQLADESGAQVAYLRTVEDSNRLKESLTVGTRVVVIGGGWIGLEVTSAARRAGCDVTVVEMQSLPLLSVLGPEIAQVFADLHRSQEVDLRVGAKVDAVEKDAVLLSDGSRLPADLVVVGIGVAPNTTLASAAGLAVDNGVLVDETLGASAPDVWAAGDIANHQHPVLGRRIRVEHWDTAIEQGKAAARNMLGEGVAYDRLPYFFTDQYDLGMEYVGAVGPDGYDRVVVRGSLQDRVFTAFWVQDGHIAAAMHANDWDAIEGIRRLVGRAVDLDRLGDESVGLSEI